MIEVTGTLEDKYREPTIEFYLYKKIDGEFLNIHCITRILTIKIGQNATIVRIIPVDDHEFNAKYNGRDSKARINMMVLIDSDKNNVEKAFKNMSSPL